MSNIVPFESAKVPGFLSQGIPIANDLASGGIGFPVVSIKGKVFTLRRGDEKSMIMKPGTDDEPASSLEVVILKAYPEGGKTSKIYYESGYSEGSDSKPTCYSNDGIAPAADAAEPQSAKCSTCTRAVWGGKVTEDGKKTKECSDAKRLAIATTDAINDPFLLRIPAASLKALTQFGDMVGKRGVPYQAVVTKIGFDYTVAHPQLTFKPIGFVSDDTFEEIKEAIDSEVVKQITGQIEMGAHAAPEPFETAKPPKAAEVKATKPVKPKAEPKVEPKPEPEAAAEEEEIKPVKAAAKPSKPAVQEAEQGLADALDGLDFDD